MQRYSHRSGGVVRAIIALADGVRIEDAFHPDIVADCRLCPVEVEAGWGDDGESFTPPPPPSPASIVALKARLKASIDDQAERERLRYITGGAGQAMTYARKVEQARAVLAATDPDPDDYLMLAASIGIDGTDLTTVAESIVAMDAAWEQIGAAIETARLNGKRAVDLAADAPAALAVSVTWPSVA